MQMVYVVLGGQSNLQIPLEMDRISIGKSIKVSIL